MRSDIELSTTTEVETNQGLIVLSGRKAVSRNDGDTADGIEVDFIGYIEHIVDIAVEIHEAAKIVLL